MDTSVVEEAVEAVDLAAVLESLSALTEISQGMYTVQLIQIGVLLAVGVILILAVMWR